MSDDYDRPDDCGCEEDINHFLYNLGFFAKRCEELKHIALTKTETLNLFNTWLDLTFQDEHEEESSPLTFFSRMMDAFGDSVNLSSVEPNFSFSMELDDEGDDDDDTLHSA